MHDYKSVFDKEKKANIVASPGHSITGSNTVKLLSVSLRCALTADTIAALGRGQTCRVNHT